MSKPALTALAVAIALSAPAAHAVRDRAGTPRPQRLELVVIEVAGCSACPLVRTQLLPRWEETAWARTVPMRFVDITSRDEAGLGLATPVETVPTIVLMRDGREIDRVAGYMAPSTFIEAIGQVLRREGGRDE